MTRGAHDAIERYAPGSPYGRVLTAILLSLVGVPTTFYGLLGVLAGDLLLALPLVAVGLFVGYLGISLAWSVGRQAERANGRRVPDGDVRDEPAAGPLSILRTRYANGEIGDEEFERRLERLIEVEDVGERIERTREPAVERA